jgi:hypothetical protein
MRNAMHTSTSSRIAGTLLLWGAFQAACSAPDARHGHGDRRGTSAPSHDSITVDRRDCRVPSGSGGTAPEHAVRCAELFVIHNGYTGLAPSPDSSQWVAEMLDSRQPFSATVAGRRNSLQARAAGVCRDVGLGPVYLVAFRTGSAEAPGGGGRWVMMDTAFHFMKLGHQPIDVAEFLGQAGCARFPA